MTALRSKAVDVNGLLAKAADPAGVRVIVTLSGTTADQSALPSAAVRQTSQQLQLQQQQSTSGPLRDGQAATSEQARILATHIGNDDSKRQRWSPRLVRNTPYMAMTVTQSELATLASDPNVASIHEDGQLHTTLQDSVPLIGMGPAYNAGATGANTLVAIMDTGVEFGHSFINPRVTFTTCFSGGGSTANTFCPNGQTSQAGGFAGQNCNLAGCQHGTHVAGIAAGNRASGTPRNGVAKGANIFAIQVFSRNGTGTTAWDSDVLAALNDVLARINNGEIANANLASINLSIGGGLFDGACDTGRGAPFKTVIDALRARNVATVIAAGNDGQTNLTSFPGCVSSAVTVSNSTKADAISASSNISAVTDLVAPGTDIFSSVPGNTFGSMTGTSMAAPHVTGAFAAMRSACPTASVTQIENALKNTGTPVTDNRAGGGWTKPRVRVDLAVQQLGCGTTTAKAVLTTPTPNSTLPGPSVTFGWTAGSGVTEYWLEVGTTVGSDNLYSSSTGTNRSTTVNNLPTNGGAVYARLWSMIAGAWQFNDYVFTAASAAAKAAMTTPTPGSTLPGASVTFGWTAGSGVAEYWLEIGTTAGGTNLLSTSAGTNRSLAVSNLPTDGRTIYVRLWSLIGGGWQFNDYTYVTAAGGGQKAVLTTPTPGSVLPTASVTFGWTAGSGVAQYWLEVGTTPTGSELFSASAGTNRSLAVNNLPTDGRTIYVRLWSLIGGTWDSNTYTYTAGAKAALTGPVPQSSLPNGSVTFTWTAGSGITQYWLEIGNTFGATDVFSASAGTNRSLAVTNLPTDGRTVYVRLWSLIGGGWQFNDYTYTAAGAQGRPVLTTPLPGSTLPGATTTFGWNAGTGVTEYWLYVGTTPGGTEVFNASAGTTLLRIVNNLPTNGSTVYVRLWSLSGGVWRFNDYTYRAGR